MKAIKEKATGEWLLGDNDMPLLVGDGVTLKDVHDWGWWNKNNTHIEIDRDYEIIEIVV